MSAIAFVLVWNWENRRRDYELSRRTEAIANTLQQELGSDLEAIRTIGDFFTASTNIDGSSFQRLVQRPLSQHLSIEAFMWVPRISDRQRYDYEANFREQGNPDFTIKEKNSQGELVLSSEQLEYFPISYIQPISKNHPILGLNLAAQEIYRQGLAAAAQKQQLIITELVPWEQNVIAKSLPEETRSANDLRAFAIQPIYHNQSSDNFSSASEPSASDLQGYIVAILRVQNLFDDKFRGSLVKNMNLYLCDVTDNNTQNLTKNFDESNVLLAFYESDKFSSEKLVPGISCPLAEKNQGSYEFLESGEAKGIRHTIQVANQSWNLYLMLTEEYRQIETKHWRSFATLMIGLLWTLIPVTYMVTSMSRTAQIEKLAQERTQQAEQLQQAFQQLEIEQKTSELLLLNVLPEPIAKRLKEKPEIIADSFASVTILFADIVGFTKVSTRISAPKLVELLNEIFSAFDELAIYHGLEKIKTIGDAYMVVGGLPVERPDHAAAIAEMALDMQEAIARIDIKHREAFCMRIGIHTGPVVAGVIGTNKFIYDLWGDAVNLASRMESHGIPGCIQVSEATYNLLQDKYIFEKRGSIPVKGRGNMTTYLLLTNKKHIVPSVDKSPPSSNAS
jgi:class 3 adenylate cyclase/CHASE1-domain containing sensor protein